MMMTPAVTQTSFSCDLRMSDDMRKCFTQLPVNLSQRNYRWRISLEKLSIILQIESCDKLLFTASAVFGHTPISVHILVSYFLLPVYFIPTHSLLAIINKKCSHLNCLANQSTDAHRQGCSRSWDAPRVTIEIALTVLLLSLVWSSSLPRLYET